MTDEIIVITLIILLILGWYFAIRKTIYHYRLLKNNDYSWIAKFFILGIPFLFIIPEKSLNKQSNDLYKKGIKNILMLVATCVLFFIVLTFL